MARRILPMVAMCLLATSKSFGQKTTPSPVAKSSPTPPSPTPTPKPVAKTEAPSTPAPSEVPETPAPTEVPDTPAPTEVPETPAPTKAPTAAPTTAAPTTPGPTPAPSPSPTFASTLSPTPSPTRFPGTFAPTPPPRFSYISFCERPYKSNITDVPCVEMLGDQDIHNEAGAFFDETGCNYRGRSVVGCNLEGVQSCRLCVFNRALYSKVVLNGSAVPYPDCPCYVPELYGVGGDIDCDFLPTPAPSPLPSTVKPVAAPTAEPTKAPALASIQSPPSSIGSGTKNSTATPALTVSNTTLAPTVPAIPMFPCERGPGGMLAGNGTLCIDQGSNAEENDGIGINYEENCEGVGCNINGQEDRRRCIFDQAAYDASGRTDGDDLADCACCVPIALGIIPQETECIFPPTPAPTAVPTTREQFLAANGVGRIGDGGMVASAVGTVVVSLFMSQLLPL